MFHRTLDRAPHKVVDSTEHLIFIPCSMTYAHAAASVARHMVLSVCQPQAGLYPQRCVMLTVSLQKYKDAADAHETEQNQTVWLSSRS